MYTIPMISNTLAKWKCKWKISGEDPLNPPMCLGNWVLFHFKTIAIFQLRLYKHYEKKWKIWLCGNFQRWNDWVQDDGVRSKEIIQNKMENMSGEREPLTAYGWIAHGIIRLPSRFKNTPDGNWCCPFWWQISLRRGSLLRIDLWLKTPTGHSFVPVAGLMNQAGAMHTRRVFAGTPAYDNIVLIEPHKQLEVFRKDNMVFAGWTVNVPLPLWKLILDLLACFLKLMVLHNEKPKHFISHRVIRLI